MAQNTTLAPEQKEAQRFPGVVLESGPKVPALVATSGWEVDAFAGQLRKIRTGAAADEVRRINRSTSTGVVVDGTENIGSGDRFLILRTRPGGPEIAVTGLSDLVTASTRRKNYWANALHIEMVLTARVAPATFALNVQIESGAGAASNPTIWTASAALAANGTALYLLAPNAATGGGSAYTEHASIAIPVGFWRFTLTVGGGGGSGTVAIYYKYLRR